MNIHTMTNYVWRKRVNIKNPSKRLLLAESRADDGSNYKVCHMTFNKTYTIEPRHGQKKTFNALFFDFHAENRSEQYIGDGNSKGGGYDFWGATNR